MGQRYTEKNKEDLFDYLRKNPKISFRRMEEDFRRILCSFYHHGINWAKQDAGVRAKIKNLHNMKEIFDKWLRKYPDATYADAVDLGFQPVILRFYGRSFNKAKEEAGLSVRKRFTQHQYAEEEWQKREQELIEYIRENPDTPSYKLSKLKYSSVFRTRFDRDIYKLRNKAGLPRELSEIRQELEEKRQKKFERYNVIPTNPNSLDYLVEGDENYSRFLRGYQSSFGRDSSEESYFEKERIETIEEVLMTLSLREREVIKMRFYEDKPLEEIGEYFNVTRERIRQIEARALRKLRHPSRVDRLRELL